MKICFILWLHWVLLQVQYDRCIISLESLKVMFNLGMPGPSQWIILKFHLHNACPMTKYGHGPAMPLTDLIKPYLYTCLLLLTQAFKNKYQGSFWYHLSQRSWQISLDPLSPRVVVLVLLMHHSPWLWKRQTQKTTQWLWAQKLSSRVCLVILLMLQKSCDKTTWDVQKPLENHGINGQPQQVSWISEPSTVVTKFNQTSFVHWGGTLMFDTQNLCTRLVSPDFIG